MGLWTSLVVAHVLSHGFMVQFEIFCCSARATLELSCCSSDFCLKYKCSSPLCIPASPALAYYLIQAPSDHPRASPMWFIARFKFVICVLISFHALACIGTSASASGDSEIPNIGFFRVCGVYCSFCSHSDRSFLLIRKFRFNQIRSWLIFNWSFDVYWSDPILSW